MDMALKRREALWGEARPLPGGRNGGGAQAEGEKRDIGMGSLCPGVAEPATAAAGTQQNYGDFNLKGILVTQPEGKSVGT